VVRMTVEKLLSLIETCGVMVQHNGYTYHANPGVSGLYRSPGTYASFSDGELITKQELTEAMAEYVSELQPTQKEDILLNYHKMEKYLERV